MPSALLSLGLSAATGRGYHHKSIRCRNSDSDNLPISKSMRSDQPTSAIDCLSAAIERLKSGEPLVFANENRLLRKKMRFTFSREGILVDQSGTLLSNKIFFIRWEHLHVKTHNRTTVLQCRITGKRTSIVLSTMPPEFGSICTS